jgi:NADH dehydrogenase
VILGAGFGGVACALRLERLLENAVEIILVDRHPYHLLTPNLYLAGAAEIDNRDACVPIADILDGTGIDFLRGLVRTVYPTKHVVQLEDRELRFDYLVVALGNRTDYFGIPGLKEHSIPFKDIYDAGRLRKRLREVLQARGEGPVHIVIGGGGFTGSELVGELVPAIRLLSEEDDAVDIDIKVIEAAPRLLPGLSPDVSAQVASRLKKFGITILTETIIKSVDEAELELSGDRRIPYDLLVWTGGVSGHELDVLPGAERNRKGNYVVDEFLSTAFAGIFVVGDLAAFTDPATDRPAPGTTYIAVQEGHAAAKTIARLVHGGRPRPYHPRDPGYILPAISHYAFADLNTPVKTRIAGSPVFTLFELVVLRYLLSILPARRAFSHWRRWVGSIRAAKDAAA